MKIGKDLSGYYKIHAKIYDLTRWSFLFGRENIIKHLPDKQYLRILEVGCGTGFSLLKLWTKFQQTKNIQGLDASEDMLNEARKKIAKLGRGVDY